MMIIDSKLRERDQNNDPIKVGIVGMGEMAAGLLNQIYNYTPGMTVVAVANRTLAKAKSACERVGIDRISYAKNSLDLERGLAKDSIIITENADMMIESEFIDVVIEMTGNIGFGLHVIEASFDHGKHVVSFNAELEATLGPYLKDLAKIKGVRYTLGDGDQPGVTLNLWRHVKMMGFEPLVCGNIKGLQDHYRNPTTQASFAKKWGMTPEMVTSFADGTKISFEQACIANATNMTVAQRGMIGVNSDKHIDELTDQFGDVDTLRSVGGIVDYVVGGSPGPGIFVYATTNDPISKKYLRYGKLGDGPVYSFYVPYHLLFFEFVFSIARLVDFSDVTLDAAYGLKVEVVALAKKDLRAGEVLDGIGAYMTYGVCENSEAVKAGSLLPMGLAEGCILKKDVKKDSAIKMDDIDCDSKQSKMIAYERQKALQ
jgi:predicted homoserine dehydrogenase-like protein